MRKLSRLFIFILLAALIIPYLMGYKYTLEKNDEPVFKEIEESVSSPTVSNILLIIEHEKKILSMLIVSPLSKNISYIDGGLFAYIAAAYENSDSPESSASTALLAKTGIAAKYISMPLSLVRELADKAGGIRPYFEKEVSIGSKKLVGEVYLDKDSLYALLVNSPERRDIIAPIFSAFARDLKKNVGFKGLVPVASLVYKNIRTNLSFADALCCIERVGKLNCDNVKKYSVSR